MALSKTYTKFGISQAASLVFTFHNLEGEQFVLLGQPDPRWRLKEAVEHFARTDSYDLAVPPAGFPGGGVDVCEQRDVSDDISAYQEGVQRAMPDIALDSDIAHYAIAALREAHEETSVNIAPYVKRMSVIVPDDNALQPARSHVHYFHADAGQLSDTEIATLRNAVQPLDDLLTARIVPINAISKFRDESGAQRYQIENYRPLEHMRDYTLYDTPDSAYPEDQARIRAHMRDTNTDDRTRYLRQDSLHSTVEMSAANGKILEEVLQKMRREPLAHKPKSPSLYSAGQTLSYQERMDSETRAAQSASWAL